MKIYQLTYTAQIAAKDGCKFEGLSSRLEHYLSAVYSPEIIVDNSKIELENDDEIIVS